MLSLIALAALSFAASPPQLSPGRPETCRPESAFTLFEPGTIARRPVAVRLGAIAAESAQRVKLGDEPASNEPAAFVAHRRVRVAGLQGRRARLVVEHRITLGGDDFDWNERRGLSREIDLADGRVEDVGGVPFLIAARGGGWTLTAQADRFPVFVRAGCGGVVDVG